MSHPLRQLVAIATLAQVVLVGALGTGLHSLFGCEHFGCRSTCCIAGGCHSQAATELGCEDCAYCRHKANHRRHGAELDGRDGAVDHRITSTAQRAFGIRVTAPGCEGCPVCDVLSEYQNAAPYRLAPLAIDFVECETTGIQWNAPSAAAIRLAHSRGPPTV